MVYCKACGESLGSPEDDLHDPNNELGIVDGGVENPNSAHIKVVDGPGDKDNYRLQCSNKGQMTKLVKDDPKKQGSPSGGSPTDTAQAQSGKPATVEDVYDLDKNSTSDEIVLNIVSNPIYGLSDDQINEIKDWVEIYDGQMPPEDLKNILSDFDGVAKQTASLMKKKYEAKLNRQIRKMAEDDGGPSIGSLGTGARPPPTQKAGGSPGPSAPPKPPSGPQPSPDAPPTGDESPGSEDLREERRRRRVERRNDAFDKAAEEFANQAASQMAANAGGLFGDIGDALGTAIKTKAKKDPDWFFEKAEKWDIDVLDALLEPSDARKQEMDTGASPKSQVDSEVEQALQQTKGQEPQEEEQVGEGVLEELGEEMGSENTGPDTETMQPEEPQDTEENSERVELDDLMEGA